MSWPDKDFEACLMICHDFFEALLTTFNEFWYIFNSLLWIAMYFYDFHGWWLISLCLFFMNCWRRRNGQGGDPQKPSTSQRRHNLARGKTKNQRGRTINVTWAMLYWIWTSSNLCIQFVPFAARKDHEHNHHDQRRQNQIVASALLNARSGPMQYIYEKSTKTQNAVVALRIQWKINNIYFPYPSKENRRFLLFSKNCKGNLNDLMYILAFPSKIVQKTKKCKSNRWTIKENYEKHRKAKKPRKRSERQGKARKRGRKSNEKQRKHRKNIEKQRKATKPIKYQERQGKTITSRENQGNAITKKHIKTKKTRKSKEHQWEAN